MVRKCIECKYFKHDGSDVYGRCRLINRYMRPNETCDDFTNKEECHNNRFNLKEYYNKIHELEMRIEKLEMRIEILEKIIRKYI